MAYSDLDLNLLKVLEALFIHRSASAAAEALSVTQPSVSLSLKRLRSHFGDELFVRQGGRMVPTAVAERLREPVARVIATVQSDIVPAGPFDPASSDRCFVLSLSDLGELTFLPDLMASIRQKAPRVTVQSVTLPTRELKGALVDGDVDLALGYFYGFDGDNLFSQKLFDQTFVCLARVDHPDIGDSLSVEQFIRAEHAIIEQDGRSQEVFERCLETLGLERHVVLRSPHFMSVPLLISQSDMITTVPLAVGRIYTKLTGLKMLALPFQSPAVELKQFWHRRSHTDPGTVWLRRIVSKLFTGHDPTIGDRSSFWKSFKGSSMNA
ncbi:LysR family transcriptional regulator [Sphingomonas bisphenolicum]|uniref:LysR family transcriptional regulator n=1 Tax=Sphingomonas bisphenolicum TaxID=296544 RepID=A0ABM7G9J1_9SPHN|nr:LysR family transcriptional regulator [Sphingomonas bisphenolicum]BBF72006.1 LysR family transcriptional regulator [Sphingomonas bisphenolicum]